MKTNTFFINSFLVILYSNRTEKGAENINMLFSSVAVKKSTDIKLVELFPNPTAASSKYKRNNVNMAGLELKYHLDPPCIWT